MNELPNEVVATDARLEEQRNRSLEDLARHRWRWTLDESNPERVTIREYARQVGRSKPAIAKMVNGYAAWSVGTDPFPLPEAIERAAVGIEKESVIDAVASAENLTFETARKRYDDVREVRTMAQERAERRGTTVEEEARGVAEERVKERQANKQREQQHKAAHSLRYVEIEGHLAAAQRRLTSALNTAQDVGWDGDEIELIADSVAKIRALLNLIDMRITGEASVDWDAEMEKLEAWGT